MTGSRLAAVNDITILVPVKNNGCSFIRELLSSAKTKESGT